MNRFILRSALCLASLAGIAACGSSQDPAPIASAGAGGDIANAAGSADGGGAGAVVTLGGMGGMGGSLTSGGAGSAAGNDVLLAGAAGQANTEPQTLELSGDITNIHDPQVIEAQGRYYLYSTGEGILVHTSDDLHAWTSAGQVFATKPSWVTTTDAKDPNLLWAPEVSYFGGKYHLFYAASSFGSQNSCIGHATRAELGTGPGWVDSGKPVICSSAANNYNAIDPHAFADEQGNVWLAFGSFWSGLKLIALDTNGVRLDTVVTSLATRANTAVEAPYIIYHGGFYYLFESVDACCKGAASTYKIMVGRSIGVSGPYVDQAEVALSAGGGTLVLQGAGRWRGPGHNAILHTQGRDYNVYHSYDADNAGIPTLRISELSWTQDRWPISAGP